MRMLHTPVTVGTADVQPPMAVRGDRAGPGDPGGTGPGQPMRPTQKRSIMAFSALQTGPGSTTHIKHVHCAKKPLRASVCMTTGTDNLDRQRTSHTVCWRLRFRLAGRLAREARLVELH